MPPDLKQIRELIDLVNETQIAVLRIASDKEEILIRRGEMRIRPAEEAGAAELASPPLPEPVAQTEPVFSYITSPWVGVFHLAGGEEPVHLEVGQRIEAGQLVGYVECMQLPNEVHANVSGTLVRCLVQDGEPVEYGQRIYEIAPESF